MNSLAAFFVGIIQAVLAVFGAGQGAAPQSMPQLPVYQAPATQMAQSGQQTHASFNPAAQGRYVSATSDYDPTSTLNLGIFSRVKFMYFHHGSDVWYVEHGTPHQMPGADYATFLILSGSPTEVDPWALDKNHVYYLGQIVPNANPLTFIMPPMNKWPDGNASAAVSATGMSQYTDSNFGFSFWYPSGWTVNQVGPTMQRFSGGQVTKELSIASPHGRSITLDEVVFPSDSLTTGDAGCVATYAFDAVSSGWTQTVSNCDGATNTPTPYRPSGVTTMGGLITFASQEGLSTVFRIVPLSWSSARKSLVITGENTGFNRGQEIPLVNTVVATDPSVATPLSTAQQTTTIQAEKDAYANQ